MSSRLHLAHLAHLAAFISRNLPANRRQTTATRYLKMPLPAELREAFSFSNGFGGIHVDGNAKARIWRLDAAPSPWGKRQSAVCPPVSQVLEGRLGLMYESPTIRPKCQVAIDRAHASPAEFGGDVAMGDGLAGLTSHQ